MKQCSGADATGEIVAICRSERKGTEKMPVERAVFVTEHGIENDAHAGRWHRQVSFLDLGEIEKFRRCGADVAYGAFGENIVARGICFRNLPIGTRLIAGEVVFEITQIGKKCHDTCAIYERVGDCIMPREGVFTRVLHGGVLQAGMKLEVLSGKLPMDAAVLTLSDKGACGERQDLSGAAVEELLTAAGYQVRERIILPDEQQLIEEKLVALSDRGIALVVTTGGTGFSLRDVTPEATANVVERLTPGIPEMMRALSMQVTYRAMLSRATAGIRKRTLIVNLPGSRKAAEECLGFVLPELRHGIEILRGDADNCAR